jgi:hypothetical protein
MNTELTNSSWRQSVISSECSLNVLLVQIIAALTIIIIASIGPSRAMPDVDRLDVAASSPACATSTPKFTDRTYGD